MRELVYVSRRKLLEFKEEKPPAGWLRRLRSLGFKAPLSLGEVSVALGEPEEVPTATLERVIETIQDSAAWYEDIRSVRPGSWVHFEAEMNYATTSLRDGQLEPGDDGPLIFWEPEPFTTSGERISPSFDDPAYDPLADVRLVLHATADGLIGGGLRNEHFVEHEPRFPNPVPHDSKWLWNRNYTKAQAFFQVLHEMKRFDHPDVQNGRLLENIVESLDAYIPPSQPHGWRVTLGLPCGLAGPTTGIGLLQLPCMLSAYHLLNGVTLATRRRCEAWPWHAVSAAPCRGSAPGLIKSPGLGGATRARGVFELCRYPPGTHRAHLTLRWSPID